MDSLDKQIDDLLDSASSNWFMGNEVQTIQQNVMPEGIQNFMNDAINEAGSTIDIQNLIKMGVPLKDDQEEGEKQDDEDDMLQLDMELPQEDLTLFKDMPNFNPDSTIQLKLKRKKKAKAKQDIAYPALSEELNHLMQQANMQYVNGENSEAISTLKEVIRNQPSAQDPWLSLAMIYASQKEYYKKLQCQMMVAHLAPRNNTLWKETGYLSLELGEKDQAAYCFKNAVIADPVDVESHFELTVLYEEKGQADLAQDSYESILNVKPLNKRAIKSLARIYLSKSMIYDAIGLFQKLIYADQMDPLPSDSSKMQSIDHEKAEVIDKNHYNLNPQRMGFEELYMFLELHLEIRQYYLGLEYVEIGLRRLLGLSNDYTIMNPQHYYAHYLVVPLQLVIKIGICLMYLEDEASSAFLISKMYDFPPSEYVDSYFDVGEAHFEMNQYLLALEAFKTLEKNNLGDPLLVQTKLGECYMRLEDLEPALHCFETALKLNPSDSKIQTQVVFILEALGEEAKALQLQKRFLLQRERSNQDLDNFDLANIHSNPGKSLFIDDSRKKKRVTIDKKQREQDTAIRIAENIKDKLALDMLSTKIETISSKMEYLLLGKKLLSSFESNSKLFSKNSDKDGLILPRGIKDELLVYPYSPEKFKNIVDGIAADEWIDLIVQLSRTFALEGKSYESFNAMKLLYDSSIAQHEDRLKIDLQLVMLSFALATKDYEKVNLLIRYFCLEGPFFVEGMRLYSLVFKGGKDALSFYSLSSNQKYLGRIMDKAMKMRKEGVEQYSDQDYAQIFNAYANWAFVSRNYPVALQYYSMAKTLYRESSEVNLYLAITYLHRASHKLESRHMHALKGVAFLFEYRRNLNGNYQSSYNVGRAFHLLSLYYLSIPFYEHALEDPTGEYAKEASYNLAMIYTVVGSPHLAQTILRKHWVFQ